MIPVSWQNRILVWNLNICHSQKNSANVTHIHRCCGAATSIWTDRTGEKDQALHPRPCLNLFCFSRRATVTGACPKAFLLEFFNDSQWIFYSPINSHPRIITCVSNHRYKYFFFFFFECISRSNTFNFFS